MTQPLRLLVVDDNPDVCFTICAIAQQIGFETRAAITHKEYLQHLNSWDPTHLLIDLQMPEVDGIQTLQHLASLKSDASIIVTSGLGTRILEAAARAAEENGLRVLGILSKPFSPKQLRGLLQSARGTNGARRDPSNTAYPRASAAFQVTEETLGEALRNRHIQVHYQPKIACDRGNLIGFEGLARWYEPGVGMIKPDSFIPLAEHTGLIHPLTRQVFENALAWFSESFRGADMCIALNVSAKVLSDPKLPSWISQQCKAFAVEPEQLILEITETASMQNPVAMVEILTQLRIKGFGLSIDDFGVGYSSLVQLARLPFSEMKIDKMFVTTAPNSAESQKIATAIVELAHALGLHVTAEGVEDDWTLDFLRDIHCDAAQGYAIARPMEGSVARSWTRATIPAKEHERAGGPRYP